MSLSILGSPFPLLLLRGGGADLSPQLDARVAVISFAFFFSLKIDFPSHQPISAMPVPTHALR